MVVDGFPEKSLIHAEAKKLIGKGSTTLYTLYITKNKA